MVFMPLRVSLADDLSGVNSPALHSCGQETLS
jgi:hypothetical protein